MAELSLTIIQTLKSPIHTLSLTYTTLINNFFLDARLYRGRAIHLRAAHHVRCSPRKVLGLPPITAAACVTDDRHLSAITSRDASSRASCR